MNVSHEYNSYPEEKIDAVALGRVLIQHWRLITVVTLLLTGIAVAYVLVTPTIYRAIAYLLPPQGKHVQGLNVSMPPELFPNLEPYSPNDVYNLFVRNLQARSFRRLFFESEGLVGQLDTDSTDGAHVNRVFERRFNGVLTVSRNYRQEEERAFTRISLEAPEPELAASWLNRFVIMVHSATVQMVVDDIHHRLELAKTSLEDVLASKRKIAKERREDEIQRLLEADEIARNELNKKLQALRERAEKERQDKQSYLSEALSIAEKLAIDKPVYSGSYETSEGIRGISVNTMQQPLYMRGKDALAAELEEIKQRKSNDAYISGLRQLEESLTLLRTNTRVESLRNRANDDPFIDGLRDTQERLAQLEQIVLDPDSIRVALIDQKAIPRPKPVRPKPLLTIASGLVLGVFFGAFIAIVLHNVRQKR